MQKRRNLMAEGGSSYLGRRQHHFPAPPHAGSVVHFQPLGHDCRLVALSPPRIPLRILLHQILLDVLQNNSPSAHAQPQHQQLGSLERLLLGDLSWLGSMQEDKNSSHRCCNWDATTALLVSNAHTSDRIRCETHLRRNTPHKKLHLRLVIRCRSMLLSVPMQQPSTLTFLRLPSISSRVTGRNSWPMSLVVCCSSPTS